MRYRAWSYLKGSFQKLSIYISIYLSIYTISDTKNQRLFLFIRRLNDPMLFIITSHDEHVQTLIQ